MGRPRSEEEKNKEDAVQTLEGVAPVDHKDAGQSGDRASLR